MNAAGQPYTTTTTYRFGYQGQFSEKDDETGYNQFEARLYDTRINRWLTTDPAAQYWSPYLGMGNNWPNGVDPDGCYDGGFWNFFFDHDFWKENRHVLNNKPLYYKGGSLWDYGRPTLLKSFIRDINRTKEIFSRNNWAPSAFEFNLQVTPQLGLLGGTAGVSFVVAEGDTRISYNYSKQPNQGVDLPNFDLNLLLHYSLDATPITFEELQGYTRDHTASLGPVSLILSGDVKSDSYVLNPTLGRNYYTVGTGLNFGFNDWFGGYTRSLVYSDYLFK